jgi:hypothetical protein
MMAARWSFEALAVEQYKNNKYEKNFFSYDMQISQNEWYASFLIDALKRDLWECQIYKDSIQYREIVVDNFKKLNYYIDKLEGLTGFESDSGEWKVSLNEENFNSSVAKETKNYLDSLGRQFRHFRNEAMASKDSVAKSLIAKIRKGRITKSYKQL